jgi:GMP synthase-like glutamine amidotransferase
VNQAVNIAILDSVPEVYWADDLGITDAQKFIDLLQPLNATARFEVYYTSKNQFPERIDDYDAILVTGSPCSVHDEHDWIARLIELVRDAHERRLRIVGSCFGHQLLARSFGGEVGHNENGWVIGNYPVHISGDYAWMQPVARTTGLYHFNQERVTRLPQGAIAFARTDEYDDYGFTLGDNVLSFQGHPEQPHRAMVNFLNTTDSLTPQARVKAERYIAAGEPDAHIWSEWMMRFFCSE